MSARSLALAASLALAHTTSADPVPAHGPPGTVGMLLRQGLGVDASIAGGLRVQARDGDDTRLLFARVRAGVLVYNEPSFFGLGIAGQIGPLGGGSLGVELQYTEVFHGFSGQLGVFPLDTTGGVTLEAQLAFTLVGVEYQRRVSGPRDHDQALVIVLQVPLGVIYQMLRDPPGLAPR